MLQKYQLLCADGTRAPLSAYKECSLGRAPPNVIVTHKNASEEVAQRIQEFLKSAEVSLSFVSILCCNFIFNLLIKITTTINNDARS